MSRLTVERGRERASLEFEPGALLSDVLGAAGYLVQKPCGGRGACMKCAVTLEGALSEPNAAERRAGARLACQARLLGDARVVLNDDGGMAQIEIEGAGGAAELAPMPGRLGAAVDIGTTTLALKLFDLRDGACLADAAMRNPQTRIAADVMGRIGAAMDGALDKLQAQVTRAIADLIDAACARAGADAAELDVLVATGNTTMLYLLDGRKTDCLSHAPFEADCLYDCWREVLGRRAYLPPCMNAFVGADISCAVLASGMCEREATAVLCDIGTNGEIALWKGGRLYVTSTAAGPAFEGAGISCGCGSVRGAIDRVILESAALRAHTIGDAPAVGVCGSGLIDAVAALYALDEIDETGACERAEMPLRDGVCLTARDVRAVQLAKAAIAAGLKTLMETAGVGEDEVSALYIAGGFGSHLNADSAAAIGLIPESLRPKVRVIGNAALGGAQTLLLDARRLDAMRAIVAVSEHVSLGGNPRFNENYMDLMCFPDKD